MSLTAVQVDEKNSLQVFVVNQSRMDPGARLVVDGEVTEVGIPPEQVVFLFIYDQFLQRGKSWCQTEDKWRTSTKPEHLCALES